MIYLDSAAVVKLVHAEDESQALRNWLDQRADIGWISSVLVEIESFRALARYAPNTVVRLPAVLDLIELVDLNPSIRGVAQTIIPVTVRSLDAIHLATALHLRKELTSFVTYDKRLAEAATNAGLVVEMPSEGSHSMNMARHHDSSIMKDNGTFLDLESGATIHELMTKRQL